MSAPEPQKNNQQMQMIIVGINMVILAIYSILCLMERGGGILQGILIAIQFFVCLILWAIKGKAVWGLSGLLVVIIGFATCVNYSRF